MQKSFIKVVMDIGGIDHFQPMETLGPKICEAYF